MYEFSSILPWQVPPPPSSASSHSLLSSSSSLSSTFSDVSSIASTSKTNAFFASPFSTRPPSPSPPRPPTPSPRSLTTDFFATAPSPLLAPPPLKHGPTALPHPSRIFPSRYTSHPDSSPPPSPPRPKPNSLRLDFDLRFPSPWSATVSPTSSDSEADYDAEPTPRPPKLEPSLSQLEFQLEITPGAVVSSSSLRPDAPATTLHLIRPLGHGAFSSVWLASDLSSPLPLSVQSQRTLRDFKTKRASSIKSLSRNRSLPSSAFRRRTFLSNAGSISRTSSLDNSASRGDVLSSSLSRAGSAPARTSRVAPKPSSAAEGDKPVEDEGGRMVAVKITQRGASGVDREKTTAAFEREVEVLRHISHPNITPLLTHLTTPAQHILVLPYLPGGDLLALVNNDISWSKLSESVLQRIFAELCKAVGWMHSVGLVHRDVKLENILLTTSAFSSLTLTAPRPTLATLPAAPLPLIKLTDFGLSRFIEIESESDSESGYQDSDDSGRERRTVRRGQMLSTRCGSEAYAAPELVMGGSGGMRGYDARETDAWACGVVLYALVGRRLPFGEGEVGREGRRRWLMRVARGEWEWPCMDEGADMDTGRERGELVGRGLVESVGARRVVERLLVRDAGRRARVGELWEDEWMSEGASAWEVRAPETRCEVQEVDGVRKFALVDGGIQAKPDLGVDKMRDVEGDDEDQEGWLVDEDGIDSIACQEVV